MGRVAATLSRPGWRRLVILIAGLITLLSVDPPDPAEAQRRIGLSLRVEVLKRSPFDSSPGAGPVLLGPQSALELEWRAMNNTGAPFDIPSLDALFQLHLSGGGRRIPAHTKWATHMTLRSGANGERSTTLPVGATTLPDGTSLRVRGSTTRLDGSAFAPGGLRSRADRETDSTDRAWRRADHSARRGGHRNSPSDSGPEFSGTTASIPPDRGRVTTKALTALALSSITSRRENL